MIKHPPTPLKCDNVISDKLPDYLGPTHPAVIVTKQGSFLVSQISDIWVLNITLTSWWGVDSMDGRGTLYTGRETKVITVYERRGKTVKKGKWQYIRRIHSILGGTDIINHMN